MGEGGLSPAEVGKEISEHRERSGVEEEAVGSDRWLTIVEALLLAVVAVLAAYSGYASSKWGTEQSLTLARASAARTEANRASMDSLETRNFDSSTFNAWFGAYLENNAQGMEIAERRFRPEFDVAFKAWFATDPANNPDAPKGPTFMDEYKQPELDQARALDAKADKLYNEGAESGRNSDDYVRITVFLASVLFLVGISGHFRVKVARYGLVTLSSGILIFALVLLVTTPSPP